MNEYLCPDCQILVCGRSIAFCPWCGHRLELRGPAALSSEQIRSIDSASWGILFYRRRPARPDTSP